MPSQESRPPAAGSAAPAERPAYSERLWVPVGWWVLAALFALSMLVAVLFYLGPVAGLVVGLAVMAVIAAGLVAYGRERIVVQSDLLIAAGANLEWRYVEAVRSLDAEQTRRRRGPDADARAYLVLRPYLRRAVEVTLDDPRDPTPYWLINTRRPDRLAAAIGEKIGAENGPQPTDDHRPNTSADGGSGPASPRDTLQL